MPDDPDDPEIHRYIEELARQGIKLSHTQVWVLVKTYDRHKTIKSLASERGLSRNGMYLAVRELENLRLLDKTHMVDREWYYICRFDISETADFSVRVKYKKQSLSIEDIIGYGYNSVYTNSVPIFVSYALAFLYNRSIKREKDQKLRGPTPSEVRSFLLSMASELEEFAIVIRQLADMNLYDPSVRVHELMGEMNNHGQRTKEVLDDFDAIFIRRWEDKKIGVRGFLETEKPKKYSDSGYEGWTA